MNLKLFETPYKPSDVNYDESRLTALENHFNRMMNEKKITSANFCLSRYGKVFARGAIGNKINSDDSLGEIKPDTPSRICSISKIICSSAIFKLMEDGYLRGNQPVSEILTEMKAAPYDKITIAHLLSHTSGLYPDDNCFDDAYRLSPFDAIFAYFEGKFPNDKSFVESCMHASLRRKPGVEWAYCTAGFILLGEVIARVTGMPSDKYLEDNFFKPLGMKDTGSVSWYDGKEETKKIRENILERANYYSSWTKKVFLEMGNLDLSKPHMPPTGHGIYSTPDDLVKFGNMLLNKGTSFDGVRCLGESKVAKMIESYTDSSIKEYCWGAGGIHRDYALGPDLRRNADNMYSKGSFYHEGAGACELLIDPAKQMVAAWFVPFVGDAWYPDPLYNTSNVMWSGLKG